MVTPGKVWSKFTINRNGKELKFRTEELPQEKFEDVLNLFFKYFAPQEPLHKASKVTQRAEVFEEYKKLFVTMTKMMNYQIDACYLDNEDGESLVVGGSVMILEKRGQVTEDLEAAKALMSSEEIKTLDRLATLMSDSYNIFEKFEVDSYYNGRGVVVHEEYRGLGLAGEILKMRSTICKERGVPLTSAWMTAIGTQKAAAKLGWETVHELEYQELGKLGGVTFEGGPPSCKFMIIKI